MIKRIITLSSLLFLCLTLSACSFGAKNIGAGDSTKASDPKLVLFYSNSCPHCKIVEQYMSENKVQEKSGIVLKEVSGDKKAAEELLLKAKICNIGTSDLGVPFLWNDGKCLVGDKDIVAFFQTEYK